MNKRELKEECYLSALNNALVNVEKTLNHLNRLANQNYSIDEYVLQKDQTSTILDLELQLASMCILLRKMSENKFIELPQDLRRDMNSIIHSNRFDYNDDIIVYSQKGKEEVNLSSLLSFCKSVLLNDKMF